MESGARWAKTLVRFLRAVAGARNRHQDAGEIVSPGDRLREPHGPEGEELDEVVPGGGDVQGPAEGVVDRIVHHGRLI